MTYPGQASPAMGTSEDALSAGDLTVALRVVPSRKRSWVTLKDRSAAVPARLEEFQHMEGKRRQPLLYQPMEHKFSISKIRSKNYYHHSIIAYLRLEIGSGCPQREVIGT